MFYFFSNISIEMDWPVLEAEAAEITLEFRALISDVKTVERRSPGAKSHPEIVQLCPVVNA